jgi:hypothetical protein
MFNFSLDWSTIGSNGPLYTPWWAQLNYFAGLMGMIWVIVPLLLATNFWYVVCRLSTSLAESRQQERPRFPGADKCRLVQQHIRAFRRDGRVERGSVTE